MSSAINMRIGVQSVKEEEVTAKVIDGISAYTAFQQIQPPEFRLSKS